MITNNGPISVNNLSIIKDYPWNQIRISSKYYSFREFISFTNTISNKIENFTLFNL